MNSTSMRRGLAMAVAGLLSVGLAAPTALAAPPKKPPTPVITSSPATYTNQTTATITFTSASATATTYCSRDFARAVACTSPVNYSGLSVGSHTFSVYAKDGKWKSGTASRSWTVDRTPPAAPTVSQPASPTASTSYSITFSDVSSDVQSYLCQLDGGAAAACTSPKTGTGLAEGYHSLSVTAVDRAGNTSPAGRAGWLVDISTPTPVVNSGPATDTTATTASFTFSSSEAGVTFTCAREPNLNSYSACTSPKSYTGLGTGSHSFRVKATDALNNSAVSATYSWTVAATAPALAWSNPGGLPSPQTQQTSGTFAFTATGQTTLQCLLDAVPQGTCTSPAAVSGLADGSHTFALLADSGLSTQSTLSYSWQVDTTAPSAPTISSPTGTVGTADAQIVVTAGAASDTVSCLVDGVAADCSKTLKLTGLADGVHTVDATATDPAGNTASSQSSWTVDTTAPVPVVAAPTEVTKPVVVTFDEDVTGVATTSVVLTDGVGTALDATQSCRNAVGAATDCAGTAVRQVRFTPTARFVPGEHYAVAVNPTGAESVADAVGNTAGTASLTFRGPLTLSERTPAATWTWRTVQSPKASGRSCLTEHRKGAKVSWAFTGRSVTWLTVVGPTQGRATLLVDGKVKARVNNYAKATRYGVGRTVKGLAAGSHTVSVVTAGQKGARAGKGTFVSVDGFKVGKRVTATPKVTAGWQSARTSAAAGHAYAVADLAGQSVTFTFRGTGVSWLGARGRSFGKASVLVDGVVVGTVDGFARKSSWKVPHAVTGLTDAQHTLVVKVLGTKHKGATGSAVVVDGFTVS